MICTRCGHTNIEGALTCEKCGTYLGKYATSSVAETGARSIRQGRAAHVTQVLENRPDDGRRSEYGDYDLSPIQQGNDDFRARKHAPVSSGIGGSRPDTRRGVPVRETYGRSVSSVSRQPRRPGRRHTGINWMIVMIVAVVLAIGAFAAYKLYMKNSEAGQLSTARKNVVTLNAKGAEGIEDQLTLAANAKEVVRAEEREELLKKWNKSQPQFYWLVGQDYMEVGDVEMGILAYRLANVIDPENYDGLMLLANAYELNVQDDLAETVYLGLIENVSPARTDAYNALIRMYQDEGRNPEAADLMLLAYKQTNKSSYNQQRNEFIPNMPQTSLPAGRYRIDQLEGKIYLTSPQGYDIYYTMDDNAVLPKDGKLMDSSGFQPAEGMVKLRAVCVSDDLVSDEFSASYTFYYRQPPAPYASLASGTYSKRYSVMLKPGKLSDKELETLKKREVAEIESHYEYYYTIDGSIPTLESPKYDGTPIQMPSGRVTLRAICVNEYGKTSSTLEVGYKFTVPPYLKDVYSETDTFSGFTLNKTIADDFISRFGSPKEDIPTTYITLSPARHLSYDWGHAVFVLENNVWKLVRVDTSRTLCTGPRGIGIGDTEQYVIDQFKDFGQVTSPNGTRGLYYDYPRTGKLLIAEDGQRYVEYMCQTAESKLWVVQFWMTNGKVSRITHFYKPI